MAHTGSTILISSIRRSADSSPPLPEELPKTTVSNLAGKGRNISRRSVQANERLRVGDTQALGKRSGTSSLLARTHHKTAMGHEPAWFRNQLSLWFLYQGVYIHNKNTVGAPVNHLFLRRQNS